MRSAAETLLADQGGFTSLAGRAEEIPLPDDSIDFVAAGQAFHWFEPRATRREIHRVLKPGRQAALIWNTRDEDNPFIQAYEGLLLDCGIDYAQVDQQRVVTDQIINEFFSPEVPIRATFPNQQIFDYEGLLGRLLSSSYMPQEGHPHYAKMEASLGKIFRENQRDGRILFPYLTVVYHAPVPKPA
jgi:SAM-dependent methyltransferase